MPETASGAITLLRRYRALADRHLALLARRHGMHSTDTTALAHLVDQDRLGEVLSAGELGELLALSGPATTAAIDRLENLGYAVRRQSAVDGRRVEVHLVADAEAELTKTLFRGMDSRVRTVLKRHSATEVAAFSAILSELCQETATLNTEAVNELRRQA